MKKMNNKRGYNESLSSRLIENSHWMITAGIILVFALVFMPMLAIDGLALSGVKEHLNIWDIIINKGMLDITYPWFYIIGVLLSLGGVLFFAMSQRNDVNSALPFMIVGIIGSVMLIFFVAASCWNWYSGQLIEQSVSTEIVAQIKEMFSVGIGAWFATAISVAISGLAVYTYVQEK